MASRITRRGTWVLAGLVLATALPVAAKDRAKIGSTLENTGIEAGAAGSVKATFAASRSRLQVRLSGLQPSSAHTLVVGGLAEATFTSSLGGTAKLRFDSSASGSSLALDFDPRGEVMEVRHGGDDVLSSVFSGPGEPAGTQVDERTDLTPTAAAGAGRAEARFRQKDGRQQFKVEIEDVADGAYDLYVAGVLRGTVAVTAQRGVLEFDSQDGPPKLPLDFDPRGAQLDVVQGATTFFSGVMSAQAQGVNRCTPTESEEAVASTGADPDGSASARLRLRDDCERTFSVEIEDVPVGSYDLFVGGVLRGTIAVIDTGTAVKGELELSSDDDDAGELLLDFDPAGATVEVSQGATVFFSSSFTGSGGGGGGTCTAQDSEVPLLNNGPDGNAKGKARYRLEGDCDDDFRVEVENLPLGDYALRVAGVVQGTITVADVAGEAVGEIQFDNDPDEPGELPLTFDPRGQTIEIVQGGVVYLDRVFP
ncbi:MAG: hypothetical protein U0802_12655 [Candidatus Binatia bacterium]